MIKLSSNIRNGKKVNKNCDIIDTVKGNKKGTPKKEVIKYHSQILLLIASNVITIISTFFLWNVIVQYNNIRDILSRGAERKPNILLNFLTKWINKNTVLMSLSFLYIQFPFLLFFTTFSCSIIKYYIIFA